MIVEPPNSAARIIMGGGPGHSHFMAEIILRIAFLTPAATLDNGAPLPTSIIEWP